MGNWAHLRREEQGFAMFSVIAATAIASLLVVATMTTVAGTSRRSLRDRQQEQALQLADAGANRAIGLVAATSTYNTITAGPTPITKTWVLAQANTQTPEKGREGEFTWVVPLNRDVIFGVGYVPSKAAATSTRVVQLDVRRIAGAQNYVFLTAMSVEFTGQTYISSGSNVHANGDVNLGSTGLVDGTASATGTVSGGSAGAIVNGAPPVAIQPVIASTYRSSTTHDLCPDGTVRLGGTATPCTGSIVALPISSNSWNGWAFKVTQSQWALTGGSPPSTSVYVYRGNVALGNMGSSSSPWVGMVVIESLVVAGVKTNGDLDGGGGYIRAPDGGIAFVVERDFRLTGGATIWGNVFAGEQIWYNGGGTLFGRMVAAGATDTPGSPVSVNKFTGGPYIVDNSASATQSNGVSVNTWREL